MTTIAAMIARVRMELSDPSTPFRQTFMGTGFQNQFDLPASRVDAANMFQAYTTVFPADRTTNITTTVLGNGQPPADVVNTFLVEGTDYILDTANGIIYLTEMLPKDVALTVSGYSAGLFTDAELTQYVTDAVAQHTGVNIDSPDAKTGPGLVQRVRYRDGNGFIRYEYTPTTLATLPSNEEYPLALLATNNALMGLLTNAAMDIDVISAEGTHIPRTQRFAQLMQLRNVVWGQYQQLCTAMGIGLFRAQVSSLRRVSRQTGRLVPEYVDREYDENQLPVRILPPIDQKDADPDGPPSPSGNFFW